jgi:hypothetical protein
MIPAVTGQAISEWIWPVVSSGYWVLPDPGSQVWVLFENGDYDAPVWIGKTQQTPEYALLERIQELEDRVAALESAIS